MAAKQVHIYGRDADDTLEWIQEKEGVVSSDDFGRDLESAQALVIKHEVLEVRLLIKFGSLWHMMNMINNCVVKTTSCHHWPLSTVWVRNFNREIAF